MLDPAWRGGTGSIGFVITAATVGVLIGVVLGAVVGALVAAVLAIAWVVHLPQLVVTVTGSLVLLGATFGITVVTFGLAPETLVIPLMVCPQGVAGVILLTWVAALRPHDYQDVLAARERERASVTD